MNQHEVVLGVTRSEYPFLTGDYAFCSRNGEFQSEIVRVLVARFIRDYLQRDIVKKGGSESGTLEFLIKKLGEGCSSGKDIFGTGDELTRVVEKLVGGDYVSLPVSLVNVSIHLKRFGNALGLQVFDASGNIHEAGFDIFEKMTMSGDAARHIGTFIRTRTVTMPYHWHWGSPDIATELAAAARYMPDILWRTDADDLTEALLDNYINGDHQWGDSVGVEVGRYYDIPVYLRIVFGNDKTDRVWRKGAIERNGTTLKFCDNNERVYMRYSCRMADGGNSFKKAAADIDYPNEQYMHSELAELILHGLSARHSAVVKEANPHHVVWRRPAEQPA